MLTVEASPLVVTPEHDLQRLMAVPGKAGSLAVETATVLRDSFGDDMDLLLPWAAEIPRFTIRHMFRTACSGYDIAQEAGLDEEQTAQLVCGLFLHDIGKGDLRIAPLVAYQGTYNKEQRYQMSWHTTIGEDLLEGFAARSYADGHADRAPLYGFSARVAGGHHAYELPFPRTGSEWGRWVWEATIAAQLIDRPDAITAPTEERPYVKARMQQEGQRDPFVIIDNYLKEEFGPARDDPLPITRLSPQDITDIVLWQRAAGTLD